MSSCRVRCILQSARVEESAVLCFRKRICPAGRGNREEEKSAFVSRRTQNCSTSVVEGRYTSDAVSVELSTSVVRIL